MEEIKDLFIKHFGFLPDIISTTEHAYISPPSRIISSLIELSKRTNVLRLVITDRYVIHPENCVQQICIPYILNKGLFNLRELTSGGYSIEKFEDDVNKVENMIKDQQIFSAQEKANHAELISLYREIMQKMKRYDSGDLYNEIIKTFVGKLELSSLSEWLKEAPLFNIDSVEVRSFLKDAIGVLSVNSRPEMDLFGKYLEKNGRLRCEDANGIRPMISWGDYKKELDNVSSTCSVPFEIILYVYSYCGGSHFGNDYNMVNDINKMRHSNNLVQITEHNKDYSFNLELNDVQFQKITFNKGKWSLSHKTYRKISTLSELYTVLGENSLKSQLKVLIEQNYK